MKVMVKHAQKLTNVRLIHVRMAALALTDLWISLVTVMVLDTTAQLVQKILTSVTYKWTRALFIRLVVIATVIILVIVILVTRILELRHAKMLMNVQPNHSSATQKPSVLIRSGVITVPVSRVIQEMVKLVQILTSVQPIPVKMKLRA